MRIRWLRVAVVAVVVSGCAGFPVSADWPSQQARVLSAAASSAPAASSEPVASALAPVASPTPTASPSVVPSAPSASPDTSAIVTTILPTPYTQSALPSQMALLVKFHNTSSRAVVFSPKLDVTFTGVLTFQLPTRLFLFPGEEEASAATAAVSRGTTISSVQVTLNDVQFLDGPGGANSYGEISYRSFAQDCVVASGRWVGCMWTNPNPYPIRVRSSAYAAACSLKNPNSCTILRYFVSLDPHGVVELPPFGTAMVPTPADLTAALEACAGQTSKGCARAAGTSFTYQPETEFEFEQPGWTPSASTQA